MDESRLPWATPTFPLIPSYCYSPTAVTLSANSTLPAREHDYEIHPTSLKDFSNKEQEYQAVAVVSIRSFSNINFIIKEELAQVLSMVTDENTHRNGANQSPFSSTSCSTDLQYGTESKTLSL